MNEIKSILHIIQPGDTLYDLAMKYKTTIKNIMDSNVGINPYNLKIGQQIYIYPDYNNNINYIINGSQVKLLKQMNLVWEQHIMWTRMLLISIVEDLKDLDATQARLLENPQDIADVFRQYYGVDVANKIQQLLTEHLVIGKELIVALKNNDQVKAKNLNIKWYKNADEMAEAFWSINPFYPIEEVHKMLYDHLKLTTNQVNSRIQKNYEEDINSYDMVQKEILKMSEFFVNGIIQQFPHLF